MIQKAMCSGISKEYGTHDAKYHSRYSQYAQSALPAISTLHNVQYPRVLPARD